MFFEEWRERRAERKRIRKMEGIVREEKALAIAMRRAVREIRESNEKTHEEGFK